MYKDEQGEGNTKCSRAISSGNLNTPQPKGNKTVTELESKVENRGLQ